MKLYRYSHLLTTLIKSLFLVSTLSLIIFFCFHYPYSFNYEVENSYQYYLTWIWPISLAILGGWMVLKKNCLSPVTGAFLFLLAVLSCIFLLSSYYNWGNEHFSVVCSIFVIAGPILLFKDIKLIKILLTGLFILFLYELFLGWKQYIQSEYNFSDRGVGIMGSIQNSGIYGIYLVTQLPLSYYLLTELQNSLSLNYKLKFPGKFKILPIISLVVFISTIYIVYHTQSRTAYITLIATLVSFAFYKCHFNIMSIIRKVSLGWKVAFSFCLITLLVWVGYHLFTIKKMSALGRLAKTEISLNHIGEHLITGTGLGRFNMYYPKWQAEYFRLNEKPKLSYFLSSDESYVLFNEPLQLLQEIGLIGFLIMGAVMVLFFKAESLQFPKLMICLKLTMIAIISSSFTSYPLHVNYILWLFMFCLFTVFGFSKWGSILVKAGRKRIEENSYSIIASVVTIFLLIVNSLLSISSYTAYRSWRQLKSGYINWQEDLQTYQSLAGKLSNDGKFLSEYGGMLMDVGEDKRAVEILQQAIPFFTSKHTIDQLVDAYVRANQFEKAVDLQRWLCNFLPNRFGPKYKLLKLYQNAGDSSNITATCMSILNMPVKISSNEVEDIKKEAYTILNNTQQKAN